MRCARIVESTIKWTNQGLESTGGICRSRGVVIGLHLSAIPNTT